MQLLPDSLVNCTHPWRATRATGHVPLTGTAGPLLAQAHPGQAQAPGWVIFLFPRTPGLAVGPEHPSAILLPGCLGRK